MKVRKYRQRDRAELQSCFEELQDYVASLDHTRFLRRTRDYGRRYTNRMLGLIRRNRGQIWVAEDNATIIGCIVTVPEPQAKWQLVEQHPIKAVRIVDLVVAKRWRGKGVGKKLILIVERHYRSRNFREVRIEVFAPNRQARHFYREQGYEEWSLDVKKPL